MSSECRGDRTGPFPEGGVGSLVVEVAECAMLTDIGIGR